LDAASPSSEIARKACTSRRSSSGDAPSYSSASVATMSSTGARRAEQLPDARRGLVEEVDLARLRIDDDRLLVHALKGRAASRRQLVVLVFVAHRLIIIPVAPG